MDLFDRPYLCYCRHELISCQFPGGFAVGIMDLLMGRCFFFDGSERLIFSPRSFEGNL